MRKSDLTDREKQRIGDVVVRRLKREVNERTDPPRFCSRSLEALPLSLSAAERHLSEAFSDFRKKVRSLIAKRGRSEELAGAFAVEILGKRLLSCPVAFADSWHRYLGGLAEAEAADAAEVRAVERTVREDTADDREAESRSGHAARTVGAWLKEIADDLEEETDAVSGALRELGLGSPEEAPEARRPSNDARVEALIHWIDHNLRVARKKWRSDERLVVFTEYKTTLDYVAARLNEEYGALQSLEREIERLEVRDGQRAREDL